MDELWTSAKHIAQSDGRKDDWAYVIDVYKSIGGQEVSLFVFLQEGRYEVLGEINHEELLVCGPDMELSSMEKAAYSKARKKFLKRDNAATPVERSLSHSGKIYKALVYTNNK
ncbi:hypothetical protein D3C74_50600 [compost metagenome]